MRDGEIHSPIGQKTGDRLPQRRLLPLWRRAVLRVLLGLICLAIWLDVAVGIASQAQRLSAVFYPFAEYVERFTWGAAFLLFVFAFMMMFSEPSGLARHMAVLYLSSGLTVSGTHWVATYAPWSGAWVVCVMVFRVLPCFALLMVMLRHWARLERAWGESADGSRQRQETHT